MVTNWCHMKPYGLFENRKIFPKPLNKILNSALIMAKQIALSNIAVIGMEWGDEGKGKIIDFLAEKADVLARFNGGNNAGHTIEVGNSKLVVHLVPSGVM